MGAARAAISSYAFASHDGPLKEQRARRFRATPSSDIVYAVAEFI
jgi:hypothetical protein